MSDQHRTLVEYERLNPAGKLVYVAAATAKLAGNAIEQVLERAADLVVETEKAFREGRNGMIEDAKVIAELPAKRDRPDEG